MNNNKKPFGLIIACSIAAQAIKNNIAPVSVILANLLSLQKATHFPKNLEEHNFTATNVRLSDDDKKVVYAILDELRGPHQGVQELLENKMQKDWVKKIPDTKNVVKNNTPKGKLSTAKSVKNTTAKKKVNKAKTKITPENVQQTVVTVKKKKILNY